METLPCAGMRVHEADYCHHAPCECPIPGCDQEISVKLERSMAFRVLLHEGDLGRVFLLVPTGEDDGPAARSLALLSVGPRPAANLVLQHTMVVHAAGDPGPGGPFLMSLYGPVPCTRRWEGPNHRQTEAVSIFVPDSFWGSSGSVTVRVKVKEIAVTPPWCAGGY